MKWFNIRKIDEQVEIGKWYVGWKSRDFEITYRTEGYQYNNAEIHISIFGWHSLFRLPWTHKRDWFKGEKRYGVYVYDKTLYGNWGWKMKGWELPFVSYGNAVRWERYKGHHDFYFISSRDKKNWGLHPSRTNYNGGCQDPTTWEYDYTDPYDGEVVPCKFWVEEMEWRRKWLRWTKMFSLTKRFIEIEFSKEMGSRKGTWKGGTVGCSYDLLPDEHPKDCIRRMEKEYKFK